MALGAGLPGPWVRRATAQAGQGPLRLGFQVHRTGIGAVYGRWYERTTAAAVKLINEKGGIAGRQVEIVAEDDGTDPKRGGEVVEKLATHHKVDFVFGTLFSHVVIASAPRAGELKIPYRGERGYHGLGQAQPVRLPAGHHDVRAQVTAVAPWILKPRQEGDPDLPDYARHDHRDFFSKVATTQAAPSRPRPPPQRPRSPSTSRGCRPTPRCSTT